MSAVTIAAQTGTEASQVSGVPERVMGRERKRLLLLGGVLGSAALLSVRMRNTAFIDEALYINAGHAYLDHWSNGQPLSDAGAFFSGAPTLYPVLAGALDSVGGLTLVRAFSLVCIMTAALALRATAVHLWGARAGLLAAAAFLFTGPVLYMSGLATFDAPVIAMICLAMWLGITREGIPSAGAAGALLALMAATKYTGAIFIPMVLLVIALTARRGVLRSAVGGCAAATVLGAAWLLWGSSVREDLAFTTTSRSALSPASTGTLVGYIGDFMGLTIALALLGAVMLRGAWRTRALALVLLGAAAMLPLAQIRLGEEVSFQKHLGYSAVFLALLVGLALARTSRRSLMVTPTVLLVIILAMIGWARSDVMYRWTNVNPVLQAIAHDPKPGLYISSATDSLKYHTSRYGGISWETTFGLYFEGDAAIREAVESGRYQTVILRSASTGSAVQDRAQKVFMTALEKSPDYYLAFEPFRVSTEGEDRWYMFGRVPPARAIRPVEATRPVEKPQVGASSGSTDRVTKAPDAAGVVASVGASSTTSAELLLSSDTEAGPFELRTVVAGNEISYPMFTILPGAVVHRVVTLPSNGTFTVSLHSPGQDATVKSISVTRSAASAQTTIQNVRR